MVMSKILIQGQQYDTTRLRCIGWTEGDGSGHEGYSWLDYFESDGTYRGADADGIEPIVEAISTAQAIAARLGNDGTRFQTDDGATLDALAREAGADVQDRSDGAEIKARRYLFADGSAIVEAGAAWDIEGAEPFSWAGA
jgi:hypothetical protein